LKLNPLIATLEEWVPEALLRGSEGTPTIITFERLIRHLENARGFETDKARWAVNVWATALGGAPGRMEAAAARARPPELRHHTRWGFVLGRGLHRRDPLRSWQAGPAGKAAIATAIP
jgi:hypothetical protein